MEIDIDVLLAAFEGDSPCGEDLEYDPDFIELETVAVAKEEQQVGDSVIAAEGVDFNKVAAMALGVLERSKDLRAAVYLAESVLHTEGFVPFERVLAYIHGVLDQYWVGVYPQLDDEDDDDPTMRMNALRGLSDSAAVLKAVRRAPLTDSRAMGRWTLRDMAVAGGESPMPSDMETMPDTATISAAFQDTDKETMAAIRGAVSNSRDHLKKIIALLDEKVGMDSPDLGELDKALFKAQTAIANAVGGVVDDAPSDKNEASAGGAQPVMQPSGGSISGAINSTADVTMMIDKICEYYARSEPSSPVPMLLKRARKLVSADFMTIMEDIASSGMDQVRTLSGVRNDEY
ncbi:MAG: type VI secretion system protein TssA [Rhodobacteraceae bacterium]|nr:type VI secretion system protein TssA [Paracoccaceae bacterium]